jgi:hypothetical protein
MNQLMILIPYFRHSGLNLSFPSLLHLSRLHLHIKMVICLRTILGFLHFYVLLQGFSYISLIYFLNRLRFVICPGQAQISTQWFHFAQLLKSHKIDVFVLRIPGIIMLLSHFGFDLLKVNSKDQMSLLMTVLIRSLWIWQRLVISFTLLMSLGFASVRLTVKHPNCHDGIFIRNLHCI